MFIAGFFGHVADTVGCPFQNVFSAFGVFPFCEFAKSLLRAKRRLRLPQLCCAAFSFFFG